MTNILGDKQKIFASKIILQNGAKGLSSMCKICNANFLLAGANKQKGNIREYLIANKDNEVCKNAAIDLNTE